jgi:hypothetical protein
MLLKKIIIIVFVLTLGACSTFSIFFDKLPYLTVLRFDKMFDLSEAQEQLVQKKAEELQDWIRQEAAQVTIKRLAHAKQLWQEESFHQASQHFQDSLEASIKEFLVAASPGIVSFLLTLDEANATKYREYNVEKSKDWFEYASSQESKTKSRVKQLEKWFGKLNKEQIVRVAEIALLVADEQQIKISNNKHWINLAIKASLERNQSALKSWLNDPSIWWQEDYKALREINRQQTSALLAMMIETMTEKQQETVVKEIDGWIEELQDIATTTDSGRSS